MNLVDTKLQIQMMLSNNSDQSVQTSWVDEVAALMRLDLSVKLPFSFHQFCLKAALLSLTFLWGNRGGAVLISSGKWRKFKGDARVWSSHAEYALDALKATAWSYTLRSFSGYRCEIITLSIFHINRHILAKSTKLSDCITSHGNIKITVHSKSDVCIWTFLLLQNLFWMPHLQISKEGT